MKKTLLIILIVIAVLTAAVVGTGIALSQSDKNLHNTFIGGTDVSGKTYDETVSALQTSGYESRVTTPLTVSLLNIVDFEVDPVQSGVLLSVEQAAKAALEYGHSENIFENVVLLAKSIFSKTEINELYGTADDSYIDGQITQGLDWLNECYGIEEFIFDYETEQLQTRKGWGQIEFDHSDLKAKIVQAIKDGEQKISYTQNSKEVTMPDFEEINAGLEKTAVDAKYSDDGKFDVIDNVDACEFDVDQASKLWEEAQLGEMVTIPMTVTKPEVTGDMLRERLYHDLLGAMSTRYTNSADGRCSNVRLCASKINEYILYPGETFAYNTVVGARTEEAGFLPAPAYVGLDSEETVKDEVGGGACQVSSTLYAATLFAFLETVERSCHIYPVNYMQLGIDATVTMPEDGQEVDFKFKNNKNYPIKIVAYTEENETEKKLTVEIWGTLEDGDYMPVEFDAQYLWVQDYDRFIDPAYSDREGYKIKLDHDTYTDASDHGTLTSTQTWRRVYDSAGNLVEETITNLPNPATGEASMDQYYEHP